MKKVLLFVFSLCWMMPLFAEDGSDVKEAYYRFAQSNNRSLLRQMKLAGYSIDSVDERNNTALCEAVLRSDIRAVDVLLSLGANKNVSCMQQIPPQYLAMMGIGMKNTMVYPGLSIVRKQNLSPYISGAVGISFANSDLVASYNALNESKSLKDMGYSGSLAFGAQYKLLRTELQGSYTFSVKDKVGDADVSQQMASLMMNVYLDIPVSDVLYPYVMAGFGASFNKAELSYGSQKTDAQRWNFAWAIGAGLTYKLNEKLFTDIGYRYTDYGRVDLVQEGNIDYDLEKLKSHSLMLGLRYHL